MRTALLSIVFITACASGPRPVNVASVRHEIDDTIQTSSADRSVTSMGKVSGDRAVVYTTLKNGGRQEETWIKGSAGWKLENATLVSSK